MFVSDLRHFLDLPDDVPGPARRMAERLAMIVRAATARDAGTKWVSALTCDRRPGRRPCPGHLALVRADVPPSIAWHCTSCSDEGVISGWERSPYDLRPRHPRPSSDNARLVVIPAAPLLRFGTSSCSSDTERFVFRAEASEKGIVLVGDNDDLDELIGYVAAEANHEATGDGGGGSTSPSSFSVRSTRHSAHDTRSLSRAVRTTTAVALSAPPCPVPRSRAGADLAPAQAAA